MFPPLRENGPQKRAFEQAQNHHQDRSASSIAIILMFFDY
jgi:hypothetical protein